MPTPIRRRMDTRHDDLQVMVTDDGSRTLAFAEFDEAYHSGCGAAAETRSVYLENSGVADRLRGQQSTHVLEVGFGTGLAALMTIDLAIQSAAKLHYVALENRILDASTLGALELGRSIGRSELVGSFLAWMEIAGASVDQAVLDGSTLRWNVSPLISLELVLTDVCTWKTTKPESCDAVYFDPFGPQTSPQLWRAEVFSQMFDSMKPGARLTTYCVNRRVRDTMREVGFACRRVPGPVGGKREVLVATKLSADGRGECSLADRTDSS